MSGGVLLILVLWWTFERHSPSQNELWIGAVWFLAMHAFETFHQNIQIADLKERLKRADK